MKPTRMLTIFLLAFALVLSGACAKKNVGGDTMTSGDGSGDDETGFASNSDEGVNDDGSGNADGMSNSAGEALQTVYFDFDRANLSNEARSTLKGNADYLTNSKSVKVIVEGHCDERGTEEYNMALGERRARAIRDYLVSLGVPSSRLTVISYGEERPAAYGSGESSWAKNRRGEFTVQSN